MLIDKWNEHFVFFCPACYMNHFFTDIWLFDGDYVTPTVLLPLYFRVFNDDGYTCHLKILRGDIIYMNDCYHKFANTKLKMEDLYE